MRKRIDRWIDGDTGVFTNGDVFRLAGVRAPEKGTKAGTKATRTAAGMSGRSEGRVSVRTVGRDKYGRILVEISNFDGSINKRLIRKGYSNKGR